MATGSTGTENTGLYGMPLTQPVVKGASGATGMQAAANNAGVTPVTVDPVQGYQSLMGGSGNSVNPYDAKLEQENKNLAESSKAGDLKQSQDRLTAINDRLRQLNEQSTKPAPVEYGAGPMGGVVPTAPRSTESLKSEYDSLTKEKSQLEPRIATLSGTAPTPDTNPIARADHQGVNPMVTQALARLHERQIYDLTHGVDPKAVQNYTQYTMANLREAQSAVDQRLQTQADIKNGLVYVDPSTGRMYTSSLDSHGHISNQAGSVSDGSGKPVESLYENSQGITRSEKNPDGTTTYYPAGGGKVVMGKSTTGEPATPSAFNPQSAAQSVLNYQDLQGVIPRTSGARMDGMPAQQFLDQNAQRLADQGVVVPGSYNDRMQQEVNAALKQQPGEVEKVLRKYDAMRGTPQFNQTIPNSQAPASDPKNYTNTAVAHTQPSADAIADYNRRVDAAQQILRSGGMNTLADMNNPLRSGIDEENFNKVQEEASKLPQSHFREQVAAERALERAKGIGPSSDPIQNYQASQALAKAALDNALANGEDASAAYKYLPQSVDPSEPNYLSQMASQVLANPSMTLSDGISKMMALTPSYSVGRNRQAEERAEHIAGLESGTDYRSSKGEIGAEKLALQEAAAANKMTPQQRFDTQQISRLDSQISELSKDNGNIVNAARLKELRAKLAKHEQSLAKSMGVETEPERASGGTNIPPGAIEDLKKNPKLKDEFDKKYGKGSSDKFLTQ